MKLLIESSTPLIKQNQKLFTDAVQKLLADAKITYKPKMEFAEYVQGTKKFECLEIEVVGDPLCLISSLKRRFDCRKKGIELQNTFKYVKLTTETFGITEIWFDRRLPFKKKPKKK